MDAVFAWWESLPAWQQSLAGLAVVGVYVLIMAARELGRTRVREFAALARISELEAALSEATTSPWTADAVEPATELRLEDVVNVTHEGFAYLRCGARLMRAPIRDDGRFFFADLTRPDPFDDNEDAAMLAHLLNCLDEAERAEPAT